jgi:hypothetical protein
MKPLSNYDRAEFGSGKVASAQSTLVFIRRNTMIHLEQTRNCFSAVVQTISPSAPSPKKGGVDQPGGFINTTRDPRAGGAVDLPGGDSNEKKGGPRGLKSRRLEVRAQYGVLSTELLGNSRVGEQFSTPGILHPCQRFGLMEKVASQETCPTSVTTGHGRDRSRTGRCGSAREESGGTCRRRH